MHNAGSKVPSRKRLILLNFIAIIGKLTQQQESQRCSLSAFYWLPRNQNARNFNRHAAVNSLILKKEDYSTANGHPPIALGGVRPYGGGMYSSTFFTNGHACQRNQSCCP
jgi:hypothetical protein